MTAAQSRLPLPCAHSLPTALGGTLLRCVAGWSALPPGPRSQCSIWRSGFLHVWSLTVDSLGARDKHGGIQSEICIGSFQPGCAALGSSSSLSISCLGCKMRGLGGIHDGQGIKNPSKQQDTKGQVVGWNPVNFSHSCLDCGKNLTKFLITDI